MSNPQKFKCLSVKKGIHKLKERLSLGSRSPSTTPFRDNVDDTWPQRTETISATAPDETLASANDTSSRGTGKSPDDQPTAVARPGIGQENSAKMSTWLGIQMFLKKFEKVLEGTPFQTPVNAVNVLIDLGNAIYDNKDALQELFSMIETRLEVINSALLELGEEETKFRMQIEGFAKLLIERIIELSTMLGRSTWKAVLESDEDKIKIGNILKKVDKDTGTFVLFINLKIERNTSALNNSVGVSAQTE
ncbi:hypothetical protein C0993_008263 [Termitomyces sp. T159_Od127]|nr:hypothetical protein C0993_008263 [Termitomyces sp. T159_Od127]